MCSNFPNRDSRCPPSCLSLLSHLPKFVPFSVFFSSSAMQTTLIFVLKIDLALELSTGMNMVNGALNFYPEIKLTWMPSKQSAFELAKSCNNNTKIANSCARLDAFLNI